MSDVKELYYFNSDYPAGLEKYHKHFDFAGDYQYWGEATPTYYRDRTTAERIKEYSPDARILAIVRDPIQRLHSQFYFHKQLNLLPEDIALEDALREDPHLITDSHYERTLPVYEEIFGKDRCKFISLENAKSNGEQVWANVQEFLGLRVILFQRVIFVTNNLLFDSITSPTTCF